MRPHLRSGDFWSGIALAVLGAYIVSEARRWTYVSDEGPGAGFFPIWYGGLMIVFSLVLVAQSVMRSRPPADVRWPEVRRAATAWVAFVACVALMPWLGFIASFALLAWFVVAVMARRPQRIAIPIAIGFAVFFYGVFDWGLDLSLPHSAWF
ncbi:MAG TPA: tripartite tricarboxylate transporter TctB family protein [Usitatibacter sp.]|nr:tripartite tricarboxylate transporter TctB family protein [Usitatibacter sp.]